MVWKYVVGSGLDQVSSITPVFTLWSSWVESQQTAKQFDFESSPEPRTSRKRTPMHFSVESGVDSLCETVSGCYFWYKWTQSC